MSRPTAGQLLATVLDAGSYASWDEPPVALPHDAGYRATLEAAQLRAGVDEAVLTGRGRIAGRAVAVVVSEFNFLAGSIGVAASERIVRAIERATEARLPLLAATASGGTRMQEGALAFLRMTSITAAIGVHKAAGLPYLVYLRHPTTGGVFASWGSLGHLTVAEPGALIGFLGPKVHVALHGTPFPDGVQTAENLHAHGLVDAVLPPHQLAAVTARVLAALDPPAPLPDTAPVPAAAGPVAPEPSAWDSISATRRPDRPGVPTLLRIAATDVIPLAGSGEGERGVGLILAIVRFGAASCVLLGQDRPAQDRNALGPGELRTARRGMRLAAEFGLPLVTVIDTPGAALSVSAEQGGLAGEIARSLADLVALTVPTVSVLLGQGTGGAALALLPADRVLAARHAWLAPLPPEGAAAILYRDPTRAAEVAATQGIRAGDLYRAGAVDHVVPERPDAADEPEEFCRRLGAAVESEVLALRRLPPANRLAGRAARLRGLGLTP
ncbi:MAG TPA: carboxyl transferase domain-containing protein [Pseudonocardia sp.]|uniref:carboxyl transferase domain-containing protein n=1 Tax=Pseudonocardia sp. TaxID=60912 RepID=UPI002EDAEFAC